MSSSFECHRLVLDTDASDFSSDAELYAFDDRNLHGRQQGLLHRLLHPILSTTFSSGGRIASHLIAFHRFRGRRDKRCLSKKLCSWAVTATLLGVLLSIVNGILRPSYMNHPAHYKVLTDRIQHSNASGRGNPNAEKIFIAANIIQEDLIRDSWGPNLIELIEILGPNNVFVSIYENDSGKGSRDALLYLHDKLPCNSSVVTGDHVPLESFPKVTLPDDSHRVKRISYLAEIRNRLLLPLEPPSNTIEWSRKHVDFAHAPGSFDRILFLNDVIFTPTTVAQLLFSTNYNPLTQLADYTAACAIDFVGKAIFYDSFAVRDTEGYENGLYFYSWFSTHGAGRSRNDVLSGKDAIRVRSCWGGIAAFDAAVFMPQEMAIAGEQRSNVTLPAIRFRSTSEPFWEASECCLIFADLEVRNAILTASDPSSSFTPAIGEHRIFINPYVRVAYDEATWVWIPFIQRYERSFQFLQYIISTLIRLPVYNPRRTNTLGASVIDTVWTSPAVAGEGKSHGGSFSSVSRLAEPGGWCGQRKMFVMKTDLGKANWKGYGKNWEKIRIPKGT